MAELFDNGLPLDKIRISNPSDAEDISRFINVFKSSSVCRVDLSVSLSIVKMDFLKSFLKAYSGFIFET